MASQRWADDDQLLAALADARRAGHDVPREFIEAGQALYTWHRIDAELAALTFDSATGTMAAAVRSQEALPRFLTFTAPGLIIALEIGQEELIGQIAPPQPGRVDTCPARGAPLTAVIDEIGCFIIRPLPGAPFRLHCQADGGVSVLTTWITR